MGEGVDEMVQRLESGLPLPPDPNQADVVPETSEEYRERIDKLKAAFEAQFLPKKEWKVYFLLHILANSTHEKEAILHALCQRCMPNSVHTQSAKD